MMKRETAQLLKRYIEQECMFDQIQNPKSQVPNPKSSAMESLIAEYKDCHHCPLCENRTNIVPGKGNLDARIMLIGEAPGEEEDATGEPFVGRSGQLLTKMLEGIAVKREDVYIANIVTCRPPENRTPKKDEIDACLPFLYEQIRIIRPALLIALGEIAARTLLGLDDTTTITSIRGKLFSSEIPGISPVPCLPIFHPAYLLRNIAAKKEAWEDLKKVRLFLEE